MSAWRAILRVEILRALPLLPWVALMQLLMFPVRTGMGPQIGPRYAFWIEFTTWILTAWILVSSLWKDSPFRREVFLATRPVRLWTLISAKFAGLIVLVVMPFVVVEFVGLLALRFPVRVLCLGTLQMLVFGPVAVLACFPLVWLWRTRWSAVLGWAVMVGGLLVAARRWRVGSTSLGHLMHPPLLLLALALAALCFSALLACPERLSRWLKPLLCVPALCLPVYFALGLVSQNTRIPRGEEVPLAWLFLISRQGSEDSQDQLSFMLPKPTAAPALEVEQSLARLVVNGREYALRDSLTPGAQSGYHLESAAVQDTLRRRYGDRLKFPEPLAQNFGPRTESWKLERDAQGRLAFDITEVETVSRWEVMGELPLVEGATLKEGGSIWSLEPGQSMFWPGPKSLTLCRRFPVVWLGSHEHDAARDTTYRFYILLKNGGILESSSGWVAESGLCSAVRVRRYPVYLTDLTAGSRYRGTGYEPPQLGSLSDVRAAGARLVILRAAPVSRTYYSWKSPEPVAAPVPGSQPYPRPEGPGAVEWLKTHPAPAGDAPAELISAWLKELLLRKRGVEHATVVAEIGKLVPARPDLIQAARLKVVGDASADYPIKDAIDKYLTRDAVQRFPALREDPEILYCYWRKGWFKDIAKDVAKQVRLGDPFGRIRDRVYADPEAIGFSEAEWLAYFRLNPSGGGFRLLRGRFLPAALIEREADAIIDSFMAAPPSRWTDNKSELLGLALGRGRVEAPRWAHEWLTDFRKGRRINERPAADQLREYFEVPAEAQEPDAVFNWFLARDPAAFRFDEATGKYKQLP